MRGHPIKPRWLVVYPIPAYMVVEIFTNSFYTGSWFRTLEQNLEFSCSILLLGMTTADVRYNVQYVFSVLVWGRFRWRARLVCNTSDAGLEILDTCCSQRRTHIPYHGAYSQQYFY